MKNFIRAYMALILLAGCLLLVHCGKSKSTRSDDQVDNTNFVASESFRFAVDAENKAGLRVDGISGNVEVLGLAEADSVIITGERRVGSESLEDAQNHLTELQVEVSDLTSGVQVKTIQPDEAHGRSYVVDYSITLPKTMDVVVNNVNGGVSINSIEGEIAVQNVNGSVMLDQIRGIAYVNVVNGQIQGHVALLSSGTSIEMITVNGSIGLDIPQSASAQFSASVVNGTIGVSGLALTDLVSTPYSLTGTLGDGQGRILLSTVNGSISVVGF
jgi:DUF4097 and DUF4098 domain-containing protein YvlB